VDGNGSGLVLGLDLGAASIGWAILRNGESGDPGALVGAGSHCFDAGVEGSIEDAKDESRAKVRREKRMPRRQHWRRARRKRKVVHILQRASLLPAGPTTPSEALHDLIVELDRELREKYLRPGDPREAHLLPYLLRKRALDEKLEPFALGRAFHNLGERRGFLSNRKTQNTDEDPGQVKAAISELAQEIEEVGARTLGEYFASIDPTSTKLRRRWTARQMFIDEFNAIWDAQAPHHDAMTPELRDELYHALFDQRPLKPQTHLIGRCSLMPGRRRAPIALRVAQRFRILQAVNNLKITFPDGETRFLEEDERHKVYAALATRVKLLDKNGRLTFTKMRSKAVLGLRKGVTFNLQEGGESGLVGNRTDAKLAPIFGDRWSELSECDRDQVVEDLLTIEDTEAMERRASGRWGLDEEAAGKLADLRLEDGHANHCRLALGALVTRMEQGVPYATARLEIFPESFEAKEALEALPPVRDFEKDLRNPAVCRALTELRRVVNAIIRRHGKPAKIHIELARDLKQPRKERERRSKKNRANEKLRQAAAERIVTEQKGVRPNAGAIEKVLLAEECGWVCPFTGRRICMNTLLGPTPQFDIEHILPLSRSLDNTFVNKTLCYHEENRAVKGNRTPHEAYATSPDRWAEILERVSHFKSDLAREKLRRFKMEEIPEGFTDRLLQDTRYMSRLAADYVALLYGGRSDASGRLRVQVSPGGVTYHLRRAWQTNAILGGPEKNRGDHRHHAIDAVMIALTTAGVVKQLGDAARKTTPRKYPFSSLPDPWPGFNDELKRVIDEIIVSFRPDRRIAGPLHAETIYSKPIRTRDGQKVTHVRKQLHNLTSSDIKNIVDPVIQGIVAKKLAELGGTPDKAFALADSHPTMITGDGREVPIHRVRVRVNERPRRVGRGSGARLVTSKGGTNHHVVIVAELDDKTDPNTGEPLERRWVDKVVSRLGAYRRLAARKRAGRPDQVVRRDWGDKRRFKFSLTPGEFVEMEDEAGQLGIYRLYGISKGDMEFRLHNDARLKKDITAAGDRVRCTPEKLRRRKARKVRVTHLGDIVPAND